LEIEPGDAYAGGLGGRFSEPNQALRGRVRQWRSRTEYTTLKIAVLTPMPSARVKIWSNYGAVVRVSGILRGLEAGSERTGSS